ncbi:glycosyltransferase family 4 protein [Denitratisoma sp. agr-D3]
MKILLVNHLLDPVSGGGTAERTLQLARFLVREGAECTVLGLDIGDMDAGKHLVSRYGVRVNAVPCIYQRFFVPWLMPWRLDQMVREVDVVLLSGHWTLLNALFFWACRRRGTPYLFCPAGALKPFGRSTLLKWIYAKLVGSAVARGAAACIAVTEAEITDFVDCGVAAEHVEVIPNGIDPDQYKLDDTTIAVERFRSAHGLGDARVVLFLGRLNPIKGPDLLLEAFSQLAQRLPDVHLLLAGPDGGMRTELEARAYTLGLASRVHFAGYVGGADKLAALQTAEVLAIPSRREAMSIVVLEAGIYGRPSVFTDTCGLDGLARAGAGIMTSVSVNALAAGLLQLLEAPDQSREAGVKLQRMIRSEYLWESQARRVLALAARVLLRR